VAGRGVARRPHSLHLSLTGLEFQRRIGGHAAIIRAERDVTLPYAEQSPRSLRPWPVDCHRQDRPSETRFDAARGILTAASRNLPWELVSSEPCFAANYPERGCPGAAALPQADDNSDHADE